MSSRCSHPETHIVASESWNGAEYETHYHCGRCGAALKRVTKQLADRTTKVRYVEQEMIE